MHPGHVEAPLDAMSRASTSQGYEPYVEDDAAVLGSCPFDAPAQ